MKRTYYMHTINGQPAYMNSLGNIVNASGSIRTSQMCRSLRFLRAEKGDHRRRFLKKYGLNVVTEFEREQKPGYIRVVVDV